MLLLYQKPTGEAVIQRVDAQEKLMWLPMHFPSLV